MGPDFKIPDPLDENDKFDVKPRAEVLISKCASFIIQEFQFSFHMSSDEYFVIWGCHQMNVTNYDRGLWVLGSMRNKSDPTVANARQMINEALIDMKLENETDIWENMVINENIFDDDQEKLCERDFFVNQCNSKKDSNKVGNEINDDHVSVQMEKVQDTHYDSSLVNIFVSTVIVLVAFVSIVACICKKFDCV